MADPTLVILARRGRPAVSAEPTLAVSTRLAESDLEALVMLAAAKRVAVAALMRDLVREHLRQELCVLGGER